jgi:hypothetical protein
MRKKIDREKSEPFRLLHSAEPTLCPRGSPMTSEELEILADLRSIKMQARRIKSHLAGMQAEWQQWIHDPEKACIPEEAKPYLQHLMELRSRWKRRELDYREARHRRMVALGHEDA